MIEIAYLKTPLGTAKLTGDQEGLTSFTILETAESVTTVIPEILEDATYQIQEYFDGVRKNFSLKIHPQGTDFQKKIWKLIQEVPYGKTVSYMDVAKQWGDTKIIRAAASANGKNPLWIIIPCHRIIGSDGSLTGYAGGLWRKKWLLEHESPVKQQSLF